MTTEVKENVLVVLQLTGGNDFMDTIIPYTNGIYYDCRPTLSTDQKDVLPIGEELAFHPAAGPLKDLYDDGKMAIIQGVGYENSSRSHFRAMDIMHTCEPDRVGTQGCATHLDKSHCTYPSPSVPTWAQKLVSFWSLTLGLVHSAFAPSSIVCSCLERTHRRNPS